LPSLYDLTVLSMSFPTLRVTAYLLAALLVTVAVGALAAVAPEVALGTAVTVVAPFALAHSGGRLIVITAGGLVVLQGSSDVNAPKVAYFAFILASWMIAIVRLNGRNIAWIAPFRRLLFGSSVLLGLLIVSAPVALGNGVQFTDWARDATPYAMLAALPLIGIDCAREVSSRVILGLFGTIGVIAALGGATDWLGRRGVSAVDIGKFSLSSFALIAALFSFAIVRAARGPGRGRWFAIAVFALVAALLTGSRSSIVLLGGFLGIAGSPKKWRVPIRAALGVFAALVLLSALLAPFVESQVSSDPNFLSQRFSVAVSFLQGGPTDPSYADRVFEYDEAGAEVIAHPLLGTGPGFLYPSFYPGELPTYTLDTPLVTPAKFGLLGTGVVVFFLALLVSTVRASRRLVGATEVGTALRAFGFIFVLDLPFGGFIEDKGLSMVLMLFLGLLAATGRERLADRVGSREDRQPVNRRVSFGQIAQPNTVGSDRSVTVSKPEAPPT
jgi:hypothetical protein